MKKSTSPKRHLFLTKNFILMLVMLVVIIMAVSAWFTVNKTVTAGDMTVKAASSEIMVAECIKRYDSNGDVSADGPGVFQSDPLTFSGFVFTKDCTGDGETLILPQFNVSNDTESMRTGKGKDVNLNLTADDAKSNLDAEKYARQNPNKEPIEFQYYKIEFYVRSKNRDVELTGNSRLVTTTEAAGHTLSTITFSKDGVDYNKKSAYGNFNVDGLAGAIRVSLIGEPCSSVTQNWAPNSEGSNAGTLNRGSVDSTRLVPEKQILWYPRPDIYLHIDPREKNITDWELHTAAGTVPENQLTAEESAITHVNSYYKPSGSGVELVDNDTDTKTKISSGTYQQSSGVSVASLGNSVSISNYVDDGSQNLQPVQLVVNGDDITKKQSYYVTKYTMNVWIEGTDTEARRAMDGGAFDIILELK